MTKANLSASMPWLCSIMVLQSRRFIAERGFAIPNAYFGRVILQKRWEKFASHSLECIGRVV